jgi:hypothetical protein
MPATATATVALRVSDATGQKLYRAPAVPTDSTVGEVVKSLLAKMGLASSDHEGRPLSYYARLNREGRHINGSERVGEALRDQDEVVLTPNIDAG